MEHVLIVGKTIILLVALMGRKQSKAQVEEGKQTPHSKVSSIYISVLRMFLLLPPILTLQIPDP